MLGEKQILCLWYSGVVKGHKTQGSEFLYCVEKDGQSNWYSRTSVILSMEQGNHLREQHGLGPYEPSTPQTMASDISLGESSTDLFKLGLGDMSKTQYPGICWLICGILYISLYFLSFCIRIKQIK